MKTYTSKTSGRTCKVAAEFTFNGETYVIRTSTVSPNSLRAPITKDEFLRSFEEAPEEFVFSFRPPKDGEEYLSTSSGKLKTAHGNLHGPRWVKVRSV